eukprot:TRINITY_DN91864_c0_g1_i1.p1 TRINITY_DN91864_c0_g1~~TRINITY_DN91864_c0_g1_i1.p1  ORF type:complete len:405 (-),score=30.14 TRINITY_DN91864_c0_g1_i1:99-1256(-)
MLPASWSCVLTAVALPLLLCSVGLLCDKDATTARRLAAELAVAVDWILSPAVEPLQVVQQKDAAETSLTSRPFSQAAGCQGATSRDAKRIAVCDYNKWQKQKELKQCYLDNISAVLPPGSKQMRRYVKGVYGLSENDPLLTEITKTWCWAEKVVIWFQYLPKVIRDECWWPPVGLARYDVTEPRFPPWPRHWLRVSLYDSSPTDKDIINMGGPRSKARIEEGRWIEVSHRLISDRMERDSLWMYRTPGSGLWFWTGKTIVVSDAVDLARYLGRSLHGRMVETEFPHYGPAVSKEELFIFARQKGVETVEFTHHDDGGPKACFGHYDGKYTKLRSYWHEVVTFRPRRRDVDNNVACPPDATMAGGWAPDRLRKCICDPQYSFVKCH